MPGSNSEKSSVVYQSMLLKLSGEAISGEGGIFHMPTVERIAREIGSVHALGVKMGVVIGGGNMVRGSELSGHGIGRVRSDSMGMLATLMNSLLLAEVLERLSTPAVVQSALPVDTVAESIDLAKTGEYLESGKVVIFAAGTGSPYFTTDTAAALRACEIGADVLLKATKVDGVYDRDPVKHSNASLFKSLTYEEVLKRRLGVMDMAAVSMCRDNGIPIVIFNILKEGALEKIAGGQAAGTTITEV